MPLQSKVTCLAPVFVILFLSITLAAPGPRTDTRDPRIIWAFGAIRSSSNPPKAEPVRTKMVLTSGDKLKMMIQIRKKCFVYVIHKDTQGNLTLLFPYSIKQFDTDYQTARKYYAPKEDGWFQLDDRTGPETFYLIASDQRLLDIEYTYQQYASSAPAHKQELADLMISQLDEFTKTYLASSVGKETLSDDHLAMRGLERATGADPTDITQLAEEIAFDTAYSETFVIDHR